MEQESGLKRFLVLSLLIAVPVDTALLLIGQFGSGQPHHSGTEYVRFPQTLPLFFTIQRMYF
jgi:hypothetical protein